MPPKIYKAFDDSHTPDAEYFKELERVAKHRIIFGGNYFLDYLNATECLIVWDNFEIDKEYYRLACERIARETAQMTLTQYLGEIT